MNSIKQVITFTANLLSTTYLSFPPYRFNLMSIIVGGCAISLIVFFIRKFFVD